ncbi:hypothetical protein EGC79_18225 [Shewanella vesiculosa]|uniref:hypothetical protein n=1 Tax=Shewanella vesiculosa TaxID=518738 RepID=UPI000F511172|nr:hypothetical protein [Shewanella vesiculosa]RPA36109.1 hypothetical protein EGC79_18225 [Shewanella vesiculosa]UJL43892.1 hypothetical protein KDH10_001264 [Shewanella vesiculosa]
MNMLDTVVCLPRLKELFAMLDVKLSEINFEINNSSDPETDGLFDKSEYFVGVGLVAAQQFLVEAASFSNIDKDNAYKLGPRHRSGIAYATAINSAANYWKHEAEWWGGLDEIKSGTLKTLNHVGTIADTHHYQLSNFIFAVSNNKEVKLIYLIPIITEWFNSVKNSKYV